MILGLAERAADKLTRRQAGLSVSLSGHEAYPLAEETQVALPAMEKP